MISWNFHCFYLLVAKRYFRDLQISKNGKFRQFSKIFTFVVWPTYFLTETYFDSSTVHTERHRSVKSSVHCWLLLAQCRECEVKRKRRRVKLQSVKALTKGSRKTKTKSVNALINGQWQCVGFFAAVTVFSIFADTHQPTVLWWQQIADNRIYSSWWNK